MDCSCLHKTAPVWPNGWMDQDATWYECRFGPRPHCARWGPSSPSPKRAHCGQTVAHLSYCWALIIGIYVMHLLWSWCTPLTELSWFNSGKANSSHALPTWSDGCSDVWSVAHSATVPVCTKLHHLGNIFSRNWQSFWRRLPSTLIRGSASGLRWGNYIT